MHGYNRPRYTMSSARDFMYSTYRLLLNFGRIPGSPIVKKGETLNTIQRKQTNVGQQYVQN